MPDLHIETMWNLDPLQEWSDAISVEPSLTWVLYKNSQVLSLLSHLSSLQSGMLSYFSKLTLILNPSQNLMPSICRECTRN